MRPFPAETLRPLAEADIEAAWHRVRGDGAIQFDLPAFQPPQPPAWLHWILDHLGALGFLGKAIFWIMVAAAAVTVVVAGVRLALRLIRRRRPRPEAAPAPWQPEAQAARALLAEADAMAADGDYGAAARLLLHRSLEDVGRHRPALVHPSATTREIGGAGALPEAARRAFTPIADAVERSLFAGRQLLREDWETARAAYRRFALPDAWA